MAKYKSIAVIYGSDSSEWEISKRSGEYVASNIDADNYDVYEIFARFGVWSLSAYRMRKSVRVTFPEGACPQVDKNDFSVSIYGNKLRLDYAYIMQHGAPGESGQLQGYFELMGIPFSTCSSFVSTIAFDKYACKSFIRNLGIVKLPIDAYVREGMDIDAFADNVCTMLSFPVFVKPTQGGSSFGVTKVNSPEDLVTAIKYSFSEGSSTIVEQGIKGRELTCAAYFDGSEVRALPPIEVVTSNDYFDYDAKYHGHSDEICPAPITAEQTEELQNTTCAIYSRLGCRGVVRMDYILSDEGLYFLEVNIVPGMTSASLVPRMVKTASLNISDFLTTIIEA